MNIKEKHLGIPLYLSILVFGLCLIGVILGSFLDWQISSTFSNPTSVILEYTSPLLTLWLFSAAGIFFYLGLRQNNKQLGIFLLVISLLYGGYQQGTWLSKQFALSFVDNPALYYSLGYLIGLLISIIEAIIIYFIIKKDTDPKYLLKLAIIIFLVSIFSEIVGNFFKGMIARPRYRNIMAEDSTLLYRNWWEFGFWNVAGDAVRSCPSGHMIEAALIFVLPLFHPLWKYSFKGGEYVSFAIGLIIVIIVGISRIYNGAHYLSDVSFGVFTTFITLFITDHFFFPIVKKE